MAHFFFHSRTKSTLVCLVSLLILSFPSYKVLADFKAGGDAYKAGNYPKAAEEFLKVAEKGDHRAMYALGSLYAGGLGVEQSYKQAYFWFRKAAKYGRPDAIYKIGLMYEQGLGLKQNYHKALKWYGKSAKSGHALSQIKIAHYYANGLSVDADPIKAYAWLVVALDKIPESQSSVGENNQTQAPLADAPISHSSISNEVNQLASLLNPEQKKQAASLIAKYRRY